MSRLWLALVGLAAGLAPAEALALGLPVWVAVVTHLAAVGALGLAWQLSYPAAPLLARRAGLFALALPGAGGFLAAAATRQGPPSRAIAAASGLPAIDLSEDGDFDERDRRAFDAWELDTAMREGELGDKLAAVAGLVRRTGAEGVSVLRGLLAHPSPETRLIASLGLANLEAEFEAALAAARGHAAAAGPEARASDAPVAIAEAACRLAESGLIAGHAATRLWQEAAEAAERAVAIAPAGPGAAAANVLLARARRALGAPSAALEAASDATQLAPGLVAAWRERCEALFALGALDELACAAAQLERLAPVHSIEAELADFWRPDDTRD